MSADAFREVYDRLIDAELGLVAISEIMRGVSPGDEPIRADKRNCCIEWVAARMAEQLSGISAFAEEQEHAARGIKA